MTNPTNPADGDVVVKAQPVKSIYGKGYEPCEVTKATHVTLKIPAPHLSKGFRVLTLPVIFRGSRDEAKAWTWNGSIEAPTLRPSVLTEGGARSGPWRCHSWINDGNVQFLDDCSHEFKGQTHPLLNIEQETL